MSPLLYSEAATVILLLVSILFFLCLRIVESKCSTVEDRLLVSIQGVIVPIDAVQEGSMLTYPDSCQHWLPHSRNYMTVLMGNDTGSDFIKISQPEVYSLGYNPQIHFATPVLVSTANGLVQILDHSGSPMTNWCPVCQETKCELRSILRRRHEILATFMWHRRKAIFLV